MQKPDYFEILQRGLNLNQLNPETIKYLYQDDQQLYQKKDIPFIKDTLLKLGSGGLMSIQSKNPSRKRYEIPTQTVTSNYSTFKLSKVLSEDIQHVKEPEPDVIITPPRVEPVSNNESVLQETLQRIQSSPPQEPNLEYQHPQVRKLITMAPSELNCV